MLKNASSKINAVAAVLALVGLILAYIGHSVSVDNALLNIGMVVAAGIAAVVLCALPMFVKNDIVDLVAPLAAIACNMYLVNGIVYDRVLMIAGIFSYNSGNQEGWTVFYWVVASAVVAVLSCVAAMVAAFMNNKK